METLVRDKSDVTDTAEIFCDPKCRKGCTRAEYDRIVGIANEVAQMCGTGWTIRIWDNQGWHYSVRSPCGRLVISDASDYPYGDFNEGFECLICPPGKILIDWSGYGETPREAAEDALRNMMAAIGYLFNSDLRTTLPDEPKQTAKGKSSVGEIDGGNK